MRMNVKTLVGTTAIVVALAGGPSVYAYAQTENQENSGGMMRDGQGGMMGQGDMMGMMNTMQQMSQMMETCSNMMQGMAQHHGPETPKEGQTPENDG